MIELLQVYRIALWRVVFVMMVLFFGFSISKQSEVNGYSTLTQTRHLFSPLSPLSTPTASSYKDNPFKVIFLRENDLWWSEIGGVGERQLTHEPAGWSVSDYAISPSGDRIAYISSRSEPPDGVIKQVNLANGKISTITGAHDQYDEANIDWINDHEITFLPLIFPIWQYIQPATYLNQSSPYLYFAPVLFDVQLRQGRLVDSYAFWRSPDEQYEVSCFSCAQGYPYECGCAYKLHYLRNGEEWNIMEGLEWGRFLGWSADQNYLLFRHSRSSSDLILMHATNHLTQTINPKDNVIFDVGWAPDYKTVAMSMCDYPESNDYVYISSRELKNCGLWLFDQDGSDVRLILSGNPEYNIVFGNWTPDANKILFFQCAQDNMAYREFENCAMGIIGIDGTEKFIISEQFSGLSSNFQWLPDGSRLVYEQSYLTEDHTNVSNIWSIRPDGTDLRLIVPNADWATVLCGSSHNIQNCSIP